MDKCWSRVCLLAKETRHLGQGIRAGGGGAAGFLLREDEGGGWAVAVWLARFSSV